MLPELEQKLTMMPDVTPENVYVELGKEYLLALPDLAILWPNSIITYGHGRIGGLTRPRGSTGSLPCCHPGRDGWPR